MADAPGRRCRGCAAVLPAGSRPQRLTCSAMCRKRWSRAQRRERARAALLARYPGLTMAEIFWTQQAALYERWRANQARVRGTQ